MLDLSPLARRRGWHHRRRHLPAEPADLRRTRRAFDWRSLFATSSHAARFTELTSQRLRKTSGIFNKKLDELELYRVKDSTLEQPLLLRMFGLGNINVVSSDATMPLVLINAVPGAYDMREKLRVAVEAERDRKRVREVDYAGDGGGSDDDHPAA